MIVIMVLKAEDLTSELAKTLHISPSLVSNVLSVMSNLEETDCLYS